MNNFDPQQYAVITDVGIRKLNALLAGEKLKIAQMAFGDGNGKEVKPTESGTSLIHEIGRESITQRATGYFGAGVFMPTSMMDKYNGLWLREVGLLDEDGDLIVWACYAPTLLSLYAEKTIMVHLPVIYNDKVEIIINTSQLYITVEEFDSFKQSISLQDYTAYAYQLSDFNNDIYASLPESIMATIPAGRLQQLFSFSNSILTPLFTPRTDCEYVIFVNTKPSSIGFRQILTIIESAEIRRDVNLTFVRSGVNFNDAKLNYWSSMIGLVPGADIFASEIYASNFNLIN
ncbi:phage tail protein [Photobacterium damselae]|uniref:phage tail-collar fiber domain-containing protein n=1 Tax=Photobacterium damselae TaxID=38293 RepID=UPI004067EE1D